MRTRTKRRINVRSKGANGEKEAAKWLQTQFKLEDAPLRNLEQVREGGYDLTGFPPFALEVKRCESIHKRDWWLQITKACLKGQIPVVMYRKNNNPWRFLISAKYLGCKNGYIQLEAREFVMFANKILDEEAIKE